MSPRCRGTILYSAEASPCAAHFRSSSGASERRDAGALSTILAYTGIRAELLRTNVIVPGTDSAAASLQRLVSESCFGEGRVVRSMHQAISANRSHAASA